MPVKYLVLDAGPLLSLSPLKGLAETYVTVPQVLAELKDQRAREHFNQLGLSAGVKVLVQSPQPASLAHVVQFAKKTGDYSVLSHADLCVLALTYELEEQAKSSTATESVTPDVNAITENLEATDLNEEEEDPLNIELVPVKDSLEGETTKEEVDDDAETEGPLYDDPSDEDDGEGEWITPSNVAIHKSRAMDMLPSANDAKNVIDEKVPAGCMTADFAMQNVLLQMGLSLVGTEGKKIKKVKTWVLRCHACFKICKDNSKKFCPSCGNPTLLRASVTLASPDADSDTPAMQIHLKRNFQYKTRGTIFSIPMPKPGNSKTGSGEGLILREDQTEYFRAKKLADRKQEREDKRLVSNILDRGPEGVAVSSWMDPDWKPELLTTGTGGKGRTTKSSLWEGDLPKIGTGRKNPNENRRRKK